MEAEDRAQLVARINDATMHCIQCKAPIQYEAGKNDRALGRVYSDAGLREVFITQLCETCFDIITEIPEPDEEPYDDAEYTDLVQDYDVRVADSEMRIVFPPTPIDLDEHDDRL